MKIKIVTRKSHLIHLAAGIVGGAILCAVLIVLSMPRMMIVVHESKYDSVEETCQQLKISIEGHGWVCPKIRNLSKTIREDGVEMTRDVRIVELCNATHAQDVLMTNAEVSTLMPCAWGVYKENGKVYVSGMNMGLMGKMFGGNIAKVMGGAVAENEHDILNDVVHL